MGLKVMDRKVPLIDGQAPSNVGLQQATTSLTDGAATTRALDSPEASRTQPAPHGQGPVVVENDNPSRGLSDVQTAQRPPGTN
jgi:hypothetical protein